jgi:hypothetical protein
MPMSREGFPLSVEVEHALDIVQRLRETFHDIRPPVAVVSALAASSADRTGSFSRRAADWSRSPDKPAGWPT